MKKLIIGGVAAMLLLFPTFAVAGQPKVDVCHAAGLAGTTKYVTINVPATETGYPKGHFTENGTQEAGHEQDYLGQCNSPSPSPSPTASPVPTTEPSTAPTPTPEEPTPTPIPARSPEPSMTPEPTSTPSPSATPSPTQSATPRVTLPPTDTISDNGAPSSYDIVILIAVVGTAFAIGLGLYDMTHRKGR